MVGPGNSALSSLDSADDPKDLVAGRSGVVGIPTTASDDRDRATFARSTETATVGDNGTGRFASACNDVGQVPSWLKPLSGQDNYTQFVWVGQSNI